MTQDEHVEETGAAVDEAAVEVVDQAAEPDDRAAPEAGYRTLHKGDEGPDVEVLQRFLEATISDVEVKTPGKFDAATEKAVKRLQRLRGLPQQGSVGPATWAYVLAPPEPGP